MTLKELKIKFLKELEGIHAPEETASLFFVLTDHFLGKKRIDVALNPEFKLESDIYAWFEKALEQLKNEYPVQYITGRTDFMGLDLEVNPNVLIPRPETEELVSWVLSFHVENHELDILEIGSGSGCIPISLSKHLKKAKIRSLDLSEKALSVAKKNALRHGVSIDFQQRDILDLKDLDETYDLIISNPPYVRESEKEHMQGNVLRYEPKMALYVKDDDPLVFYKTIARLAQTGLRQGGELFFEINQFMGKELITLLRSMDFVSIALKKDIYGADRMIRAVKN